MILSSSQVLLWIVFTLLCLANLYHYHHNTNNKESINDKNNSKKKLCLNFLSILALWCLFVTYVVTTLQILQLKCVYKSTKYVLVIIPGVSKITDGFWKSIKLKRKTLEIYGLLHSVKGTTEFILTNFQNLLQSSSTDCAAY